MSSATAASPTAASGFIPTPARRRWRASSRIAAASAPPRSASSSPMPAARRRRSGPGRAARRWRPSEDPWPTIAPSALPFGPGWHTPRAMTEDDMARVRDAFVDAAKRAVRIGFDAIELHFAHGYLLHSFVSPLSNKRNDDYGGSLEGRMRFPLEVARAVRAAVPRACRSAPASPAAIGWRAGSTGDDAVAMAKALKDAGPRLRRRLVGRHHAGQPLADRTRLQRADRRAGAPRDRHCRPAPSA